MDTSTANLPPKIGSYEIRSLFSDNGRTRLLYAYDQHFGIEVIIKFLPADFFADPDFRAHFAQDMRRSRPNSSLPLCQSMILANLKGVLTWYNATCQDRHWQIGWKKVR